MILSIIQDINNLYEKFFAPMDALIEKLPLDEWVSDAIIDSIHLLPFLFVIFVIIELIEFYLSDRINHAIRKKRKRNIIISSLASIFPQCGFSVMASSLYSKKIITRGCLIAVFLGTSDECLPILLAYPQKAYLVLPVVFIKFTVAIMAGYFFDFVWSRFKKTTDNEDTVSEDLHENHYPEEAGCCYHNPQSKNKRELIIHPVLHTLNIFSFILVITLLLNYLLNHLSLGDILIKSTHNYIVCIFSAILGLIPNCAVSIGITMMLIKGQITFGAAMSGLLSNSGLGLLVLLKNNKFKDTFEIIVILLVISIISGIAIDWAFKFLF